MLTALWDWLFTRRIWEVVRVTKVYFEGDDDIPRAHIYVMRDQFGNMKEKRVKG